MKKDHECKRTFPSSKIDYCCGERVDRCYGSDPMILEVWFQDKDGQEFYHDNWTTLMVNYCPFCGMKATPNNTLSE